MKGDFSRLTFTEKNHYRRVLMQQGRVEIDADGNEQIAIDDHIAATTTTDVVGQSGYPVTAPPTGGAVGGFALGLNAAGTDLTIAPGRMYVDGLLVENDTLGATLLSQPDMPGTATVAAFGATESGIYVVYLDVWERLITALDNPSIRESALGGPDTSVRTQVVWQAKLAYSGAVPAAGSPLPTCATAGEPWLAGAASTGTLAASSAAPGTDLPCILPPETGYQRLENQLYRVEIHEPGPDGTATFKWSRENGSVVALISGLPASSGGASGTGFSVSVTSLSDDPSLGLQAEDWVELIDDNSELTLGHGTLYQVAATPADGHTVTITVGSTVPTIDLTLHPKLRRWDQGSAGGSQGITVATNAAILLEGGVQVQFSAGTYQAGDYWLIPARTATSIQQGYVEWPVDTSSNAVPQPPAGIRHHYAQLGLVEFTAPGTFGGLGTAAAPTDCRLPFLPLTDLMPAQSLSPCTFVVQPGPGWEQPILTYFGNAPVISGQAARLDAEICFPVGNFPVSNPLVVSNAGHIRINGAGWGTRLIAAPGFSSPESVLKFAGCLSVAVRDLYGETSLVTSAPGSAGRNHINGTLAFSNCGEVTVENVWLRCGSAISTRAAACVSVASDVTQPNGTSGNVTTGAGSARIRGCLLHVGEMQVGIQLTHQERASVEDNEILVDPDVPRTTLDARLTDPVYRAIARSYLISQAQLTAAAPSAAAARPAPAAHPAPAAPSEAPAPSPEEAATTIIPAVPSAPKPSESQPAGAGTSTPAALAEQGKQESQAVPVTSLAKGGLTVNVGNQTLTFVATKGLETTWQTYLDANAPKTFATQTDALRYLKTAANTILTNPAARTGLSGFGGVLHILNEHIPLAGRGIVVGGQAISDLRIADNTLSGVLMGISVGVSHRASAAEKTAKQRTPDHMGTIGIIGNTIECSSNDLAVKNARFGIFVGSANSLEIDDNRLTLTPVGITTAPPADAIRVVGYLGLKAVIRRNHMTGFAMGIRGVPLTGNGPGERAPVFADGDAYLLSIRAGSQWLVADNAIEGASATPPIGPFWKTVLPTPSPQNPPDPNPAATPGPYIDAYSCLQINNVFLAFPRVLGG